jgi:outer membrane protein TolC
MIALTFLVIAPFPASSQTLSLVAAVDSALAAHPALERVAALAQGAADGVDAARAARMPSVGLDLSLQHFQEPMVTTPIHGFDPDRLPTFDETLVQGSLGLRHRLLDWGDRSSTIAAAEAEARALGATTRAVRADVIARVADAYLRVATNRAVDTAALARIEALEAEHDRVLRGLEVGAAAEVEVMRAAVAVQDARAERISSLGALGLAERDLARLMGTTVGVVAEADLARLDVEGPLAQAGPLGLGASTTSPAIEEAVFRSEAARARLAARRAGRLPRLDLSAALLDYGTLSSDHLLEWQAGVRMSWPLFTGGGRGAAIRRAEAELLAAEFTIQATALDLEAGADAARTAMDAADARVEALDSSVSQWEALVRVETLALESGSGVQRDLLDAQAGLFRARAGSVGARAEAVMARVRFAQALGELDRGWIVALGEELP